jgi:hypothetical protein
MDVYDNPPSREYINVMPGYVFRCQCGVRHDARNYQRPWSAEKAIKSWNHHSSIWPTEAARQRRKMLAL